MYQSTFIRILIYQTSFSTCFSFYCYISHHHIVESSSSFCFGELISIDRHRKNIDQLSEYTPCFIEEEVGCARNTFSTLYTVPVQKFAKLGCDNYVNLICTELTRTEFSVSRVCQREEWNEWVFCVSDW